MGITCHNQIVWAIDHIGEGPLAASDFLARLNLFFLCFYCVELVFRLLAERCAFFTGQNYRWNLFDLVLVVLALYEDIVSPLLRLDEMGLSLTWLRMLRFMKMMKVLRVIRVMRCFKELRTIVQALTGSIRHLLWSVLTMGIIMYVFGICMVQGVTSLLAESDPRDLDPETLGQIETYWSSLNQAMLSLFFAVSGGADWADLAAPLMQVGSLYYVLFLFFMVFAMISMLNVLAGMYVDAAMKVVDSDDQSVQAELSAGKEIEAAKDHLQSLGKKRGTGDCISVKELMESIEHGLVMPFFKAAEIAESDVLFIIDVLARNGHVVIDDFLSACLKVNSDIQVMETLKIRTDVRCCNTQLAEFMEYAEDTFTEIQRGLPQGPPRRPVTPLQHRLAKAHCLPPHWAERTRGRRQERAEERPTNGVTEPQDPQYSDRAPLKGY